MRRLAQRLANVRMLAGMRIRHLQNGNRRLLYQHRHALLFSAAPAVYALVYSPDVVAEPVIPFAQAAPASVLTPAFAVYLVLSLVWLCWQSRLLATDAVANWCRHLPIGRSDWRISHALVALRAIGPMWLPWLLAPVSIGRAHAAIDLPHYLLALGIFGAVAILLVSRASRALPVIAPTWRQAFPVVDLQLGILLDRHKFNLLLRQGLMVGIVAAMRWLWTRPHSSIPPATATEVALCMAAILDGGAIVLLGAAHARADGYFGQLPLIGRRVRGDITVSLVFLLPALVLAVAQLFLAGSGVFTLATVLAAPIIATVVGALPAVSRSADRRLLWWVGTVAAHALIAYRVC